MPFPFWQTTSTAATRLAARCDKSLFMGPRLLGLFPALAIKACYHRFAIVFVRIFGAIPSYKRPLECGSLLPLSSPTPRLTRRSAKCYKSTLCVRPYSGPTGAAPLYLRRQIGWVRVSANPDHPGNTEKQWSCPVLEVGAFEIRRGVLPALLTACG